jgi:CMP-N-acetylneuraminic acid synthetase/spore coat polysaccharide biosynthesis predicted glycosyltransferase SpsG
MSDNILIIIPARGGSKGIPRKNLRLLNNKPLIYYVINQAIKIPNAIVYVSTDDKEIEILSTRFGANVIFRTNDKLSNDQATLDPVIYEAYNFIEKQLGKVFDLVVTMQPTSPLIRHQSLINAIDLFFKNKNLSTVISAVEDTHLSWSISDEKVFMPNYNKRLNRQYLKKNYKETGGFLITRREFLKSNSRIGPNVELYLLDNGEEIDIDNFNDWNVCEYLIRKQKVLFVVRGNSKIGLGHVYNLLGLASVIVSHDIEFLVLKGDSLAFNKIKEANYKVSYQVHENILEDIQIANPKVVINDILDTSFEYIQDLKDLNLKVVNFEDLGSGSEIADLVFNPIYENLSLNRENKFFGQKYFILRDEFIYTNEVKVIKKRVKKVMLSFGGVDPNNLTCKVLDSIYDFCVDRNIEIIVITGFGYEKFKSLSSYIKAEILKDVSDISKYMYEADLIFTSAGRTIYEICSTGTPAIVLAQNERELTHFFANSKYGFINLGLGNQISSKLILEEFKNLLDNFNFRKLQNKTMINQNLKLGKSIVRQKILELIEDE